MHQLKITPSAIHIFWGVVKQIGYNNNKIFPTNLLIGDIIEYYVTNYGCFFIVTLNGKILLGKMSYLSFFFDKVGLFCICMFELPLKSWQKVFYGILRV
jgi:hypothetical protein